MNDYAIKELQQILDLIGKQKIVCNLSVVIRLKDLQRYLEGCDDKDEKC